MSASANTPQLTCPKCGAPLPRGGRLAGQCLVCLLELALEEKEVPTATPERFGHYQVATNTDGTPMELGRGTMGVTYKAFDADLHCPVTLKVISERYLGDESARRRFLRGARAAASVRHPNVASVFHLGRTGQNYFYAMEFVEGETLENLIKRFSRLEIKVALEIATQVAAGLAAIHKQKLVHRDIKPSNIMVSLEEGGAVTAKIIDLGLAKPAPDARSAEAAISTPGAFAGTPEFASPEQFAGVGVDIRSDLYSLGVTLWEMISGRAPFQGSSAEVMYQHQYAPLPLEQLKSVPQPVVVLLEMLLKKDPGGRFKNPVELLKALPTVTAAIEERRTNTHLSLQEGIPGASGALNRKLPSRRGPKNISLARLPVTGKRGFWPRGGYHFSGRCVDKPVGQCRYYCSLGGRRKIDAGQPLAPTDGC
jgi:serine/threonine protein kinase